MNPTLYPNLSNQAPREPKAALLAASSFSLVLSAAQGATQRSPRPNRVSSSAGKGRVEGQTVLLMSFASFRRASQIPQVQQQQRQQHQQHRHHRQHRQHHQHEADFNKAACWPAASRTGPPLLSVFDHPHERNRSPNKLLLFRGALCSKNPQNQRYTILDDVNVLNYNEFLGNMSMLLY